jgi:SAM-dependent methyltransferase
VSDGYGEDLAAIHADGFTMLAEGAAREAHARLAPRSRVLELGCGDGTTAALLVAAGHEVVGVDASPAMIELARARVPGAEFVCGSFVDVPLPPDRDAVLAVGEVLGYLLDERAVLDEVLARVREALRPGGLLLFDLAGPGRVPPAGQRAWTEGDGWTVMVDAVEHDDVLERRIVAFRDRGDGDFRRTEEVHRLRLYRPFEVLEHLRAAGFAAEILPNGYAGETLPGTWAVFAATADAR